MVSIFAVQCYATIHGRNSVIAQKASTFFFFSTCHVQERFVFWFGLKLEYVGNSVD